VPIGAITARRVFGCIASLLQQVDSLGQGTEKHSQRQPERRKTRFTEIGVDF
jgi:hypothetical protein